MNLVRPKEDPRKVKSRNPPKRDNRGPEAWNIPNGYRGIRSARAKTMPRMQGVLIVRLTPSNPTITPESGALA